MALFDVYVEGATDPSPAATRRLAELMSQRYGLPVNELVTRLAKGRFRVKANVDQATAATYAKDLEHVGARVAIVETGRAGPSLPPANRPAGSSLPPTNRPSGSSLPPTNRPAGSSLPPTNRPSGSSLPPANRPSGSSLPPANQPYASGLAAAFSEDTPVPELGALDNAELAIAALDGTVEKTPEPAFGLPASIGPASAPAPKTERPKDLPLDLFAPPEAQQEEFKVELAADEIAHRESRKRMSMPPATQAPTTPSPPSTPSTPVLRKKATTAPPPTPGMVTAVATDEAPRWRFAAGVLASVLLGFIPAHCVASVRERAADEAIDEHVISVQAQAHQTNAPVPYAQLDAFREEQRDRKQSKHRDIALVSLLIWGVCGAGVGYLWFRRVPWDKLKLG